MATQAGERPAPATVPARRYLQLLIARRERPPPARDNSGGSFARASCLTAHLAHSAATGAVEGIDAVCGVVVPPPRLKAVSRGLLRLLAHTFHVEPIAVVIVVRTCTLRRSYEC